MERDELLSKLARRRRRDGTDPVRTRRPRRRERPSAREARAGRGLVRRSGRGVAARRAARRRPRLARACSTPAPRPAARRRRSRARWPSRARRTDRRVRRPRRRIELLRRTVQASGATQRASSSRPIFCSRCPSQRRFDCVIVDAPCSGLGTLRRDPDIRWRRREQDLADARRRAAADAAARAARWSRLAAGSCTPPVRASRRRTKQVVDRFLAASPAFRRSSLQIRRSTALPHDVVDSRGFLRTLPHVHALEAFFGAVLAAARSDDSRVHGSSNSRLERGQRRAHRRSAGRDVRAVCGCVDAPRAPRARGAGAGPHQPHGERGDSDRRRSRPHGQGRRSRGGRTRRSRPAASSRRNRPPGLRRGASAASKCG